MNEAALFINYVPIDDPEFLQAMAFQGRRRKGDPPSEPPHAKDDSDEHDGERNGARGSNGDDDESRTRPIGPSHENQTERDPENTRDMLWLYLQAQLKQQKTDSKDLRDAIKEVADAQNKKTESDATSRRYEAQIAGVIGLVLVLGLLVITGAKVGVRYGGLTFNAGDGDNASASTAGMDGSGSDENH